MNMKLRQYCMKNINIKNMKAFLFYYGINLKDKFQQKCFHETKIVKNLTAPKRTAYSKHLL